VRVGDTVRRPQYPWSASVHELLLRLESVGFPYSPRLVGIDEEGREILTFIDGICGADGYVEGVERGAEVWAMVASEDGLRRFARLLRSFHDAVDGTWCHGDFGPWNVVWQSDGTPIGIIDWDYATPGPPIDDVAYALEWSVPFCADDDCVRWRRFDAPPDRRRRIEIFASAYGLPSTDGLVDAVLRRQHAFRDLVVRHAEEGIPLAVDEVADGYLDVVDARIAWTEQHRHLLE
jgi:hypothetical protein